MFFSGLGLNNYIIIIYHQYYIDTTINVGACKSSSVAQLVESRTQKPKCMGSNHGVDNRLLS